MCLKVLSTLQALYLTLKPCLLALLQKQVAKQNMWVSNSELWEVSKPLAYKYTHYFQVGTWMLFPWNHLKHLKAKNLLKNTINTQFWTKTHDLHFHSCVLKTNHSDTFYTSYQSNPYPCFLTVTPQSLSTIFKYQACRLTWVEIFRDFQGKVRVGIHSRRSRQAKQILRPSQKLPKLHSRL